MRPQASIVLKQPVSDGGAGVEEVGSDGWMKQHESLQRLNLQAHHNVAAMSDEFVKEAFISLDKFNELVHELLVVEIWKEKVYPLLGARASASTWWVSARVQA